MPPALLAQLKSAVDTLAQAERRVAQWILAHPEQATQISVQALAAQADTSVATVIRLARHLGCKGFADLKISLARQATPGISAMYEAVGEDDGPAEVVSKVFGGNSRSLDETLKMLDPAALDQAAGRIARCRRCLVLGLGSSGYMAQDAALRLAHLGICAEASPGPLETLIRAHQLGPQDVAIGISHSGRSASTVESLQAARQRGAYAIGISNYPLSPLQQASDAFFCLAFPESRVRAAALSSRVSQVCLIDALYLLVARHVSPPAWPQSVDETVERQFRLPPRKTPIRP